MAGTARIATGDVVVWLKPVAVVSAVVCRDAGCRLPGIQLAAAVLPGKE